jgi:hypothetical protein
LVEFIRIQKLKVVGLVELQMTRDNHIWWWNFKNQRNAKRHSEIVAHNKKSQLYMSIDFDPR